MRKIKLNNGGYALVDNEDFEWLSQWDWTLRVHGRTSYAIRFVSIDNKTKAIRMHRMILGLTDRKVLTDHRDGNGLNNRRKNLRKSTSQQNSQNRRKRLGMTSIYKGVHREGSYKKTGRPRWRAVIIYKKRNIKLGAFDQEVKAAKAYDKKAIELFGEFAKPNFQEVPK